MKPENHSEIINFEEFGVGSQKELKSLLFDSLPEEEFLQLCHALSCEESKIHPQVSKVIDKVISHKKLPVSRFFSPRKDFKIENALERKKKAEGDFEFANYEGDFFLKHFSRYRGRVREILAQRALKKAQLPPKLREGVRFLKKGIARFSLNDTECPAEKQKIIRRMSADELASQIYAWADQITAGDFSPEKDVLAEMQFLLQQVDRRVTEGKWTADPLDRFNNS
ncbi:MAG: hypothetical protein K9M51_02670 [Candidatus Gracilibacteria bacterium]|nr:hypothetical protein [Candidatus Gracilibacteria bacterium]